MPKTLRIIVKQDKFGIYTGRAPELNNITVRGRTLSEIKENMARAVDAYLESKRERHEIHREFTISAKRLDDGYWLAEVAGLDSCTAKGCTPEELSKNLKDAIELWLRRDAAKRGKTIESFSQGKPFGIQINYLTPK
ncbi:MAG: hypothetical protein HYT16_00680 [DPANN group archaeon]|nr:hypothetical protein [DPANN group archaeon]